jgi:hypothetical protein
MRRCPTECQLSRSNEPWRCVVSLHLVTGAGGVQLAQPKRINFGDPIFNKTLVTDRIRRAQSAILNPDTENDFFLDAPPDDLEDRDLSFSSNSVCLEISGKDVEDLSFVDLPGGYFKHIWSDNGLSYSRPDCGRGATRCGTSPTTCRRVRF